MVTDSAEHLLRRRRGVYDNRGNLTGLHNYSSATDNAVYNFTYDQLGNLTAMEDPLGLTYAYSYETAARQYPARIEVYNASDSSTRYESGLQWNPGLGVQTAGVDSNGNREERTYDSFGRLTDLRSPYDSGNTPVVAFMYSTPQGSYPWYTVTRNKLSFDPGDEQAMRPLVFADGLGRQLYLVKEGETGYATGRRTGWNCSGAVVYDNRERVVAEGQTVFWAGDGYPPTPPLTLPERTTYDPLDRIIGKELPDGSLMSTAYLVEEHNNLIRTSDPLGNVSEQIKGLRDETLALRKFDGNGQLLTCSAYTYNPLGLLLTARDYYENAITYTYDLLERRTSIHSPESGLKEFFYDAAGNLIRKTDSNLRAGGESILYQYDGFNRLVRTNYPRMQDTEFVYGAPGAGNNQAGRLLGRTDESGSLSYEYGLLGETTAFTRNLHRLTTLAEDKSATIRQHFDYLGRITAVTYPDGETLHYAYDNGGQVTSVTGQLGGLVTSYVEEIGYDEYGQRIYIRYGNGNTTFYTYHPARRWIEHIYTENAFTTALQDINYTFDSVGNVTAYDNITEAYETRQSYSYDSLYQLISAAGEYESSPFGSLVDFSSDYQQRFSYDVVGNILTKTSGSVNSSNTPQGQNLNYFLEYFYYPGKPRQAEQIGRMWYTYDANGNVIEEREGGHAAVPRSPADLMINQQDNLYMLNYGFGLERNPAEDEEGSHTYTRQYIWDEENRLKHSSDEALSVEYLYDADGRRTCKKSERGETLYFDNMWSLTTDYPDFRQSKQIYLGDKLLAVRFSIEGDGFTGYPALNTFYYHSDHLGSAQLITDPGGEVYEHLEYAPYGELWIEEQREEFDKIPFRFTGKEFDRETNNYYYGARYLNPQTARWLSPDPAGPDLADPANDSFSLLEGMNWYAYCANNPVKYTDPDGNRSRIYHPGSYGYQCKDIKSMNKGINIKYNNGQKEVKYQFESHHLISDKTLGNLGIKKKLGPAIEMNVQCHKKTDNWGGRGTSKAERKREFNLVMTEMAIFGVTKAVFKKAFMKLLDNKIDRLKKMYAPGVYDQALDLAKEYAKSDEIQGVLDKSFDANKKRFQSIINKMQKESEK